MMNKYTGSSVIIMLVMTIILVMFALLAGCNNASEDSGDALQNQPDDSQVSSDSLQSNRFPVRELKDSIYVAQFITLPSDIGYVSDLAYYDGKVYIAAMKFGYASAENLYLSSADAVIYEINTDATGLAELAGYAPLAIKPDDAGGSAYIGGIAIDEEGCIWVAEEWSFYRNEFPDDFDMDSNSDEAWKYSIPFERGNAVRKLDITGAELFSADISGLFGQQENTTVSAFAVAGDSIYIGALDFDKNTYDIYVLDKAGNLQYQLKTESNVEQFICMSDGSVAFPTESGALQTIDTAAQAFGEIVENPDVSNSSGTPKVYEGNGGFDILISDDTDVYGYALGEEEAVRLVNWTASNVVKSIIGNITMTSDGRIICTNMLFSGADIKYELIILTETLRSELPEKAILTIASLGLSQDINNAIASFNRTNLSYRIEIVNYSKFNNDDDPEAGLTRLYTEIISGNVPDILYVSYLPYADYVAAGLLADLYPFIDADPQLNRSDFVQAAFRNSEINGGLYRVFPSFFLNSVIGAQSVVGSQMGWTMEEFTAVMEAHPNADMPIGIWLSKVTMLRMAVGLSADCFIDWETGTVSFDTPEFIQLLELTNKFPGATNVSDIDFSQEIPSSEAIAAGRQLLLYTTFDDFLMLQYYRAMFGGEIAFKGFPTASRNSNLLYAGESCLAIIENSPNKEAAWSFVRTILDKDWQLDTIYRGFPTHQAAFDEKLRQTLELDYSSGMYTINELQFEKPTQADIDMILALMESAGSGGTGLATDDEVLWNIISESAADYFYGLCSAADAARVIQSKVSIYVSERT